MVDKEDNINNYSYLAFARMIITASPTLLSGEGKYLSTMETIRFNNGNNKHPMARAPRNLNYLNQKQWGLV